MANREQVMRLLAGVDGWNRWRLERPGERPDLRGSNLSAAVLRRADLRRADLRRADLIRTNLSGADLRRADLSGADLSGADLSGADLRRTHFISVNLHRADLSGADLREANLSDARLYEAVFHATIMGDVDLRNVQGLDTIRHRGPSTLGLDTIERSYGQIPETFLRGCGVSDRLIEYIPSLTTQPIQYYSCFISYSSQDESLAKRLHADLQANGVRCWFAPHDLIPGEYYVRGIDEAIRLHDKLVLLLSESAVKSTWVEFEVQAARSREAHEGRIVLYPVRLDDTVLTTTHPWAVTLRTARHIGDFRQWKQHDAYQQAFARLLRDLRSERTARR